MTGIVTISLNPDGTQRVSVIERDGERLITPSVELSAACGHLWRALVCGSLEYGHTDPVERIAPQLVQAAELIERAKADLVAPLAALDTILTEIRNLTQRFAALEIVVRDGWMSSAATKAWFDEHLKHTQTSLPPGAQ
jgi:hypothetical protein